MNSAQMTVDFGTDSGRAVHGTVRPLVVPDGFRLLEDAEPLQEGDMVWLPNNYIANYLDGMKPWVEIIVLHDGNSMRDAPAIRRHNSMICVNDSKPQPEGTV